MRGSRAFPDGLLLVLDPGQFLMERKTLLGIKARAERLAGNSPQIALIGS